MKKEKITIEQIKEAFAKIPCGEEFTRKRIIEIVTAMYGAMEVIPSDYCYNRVNAGIDIEKNLKEHRCLFEYVERNRYKYIGSDKSYNGPLYCKPKGCCEYVAGEIKDNVVYWHK